MSDGVRVHPAGEGDLEPTLAALEAAGHPHDPGTLRRYLAEQDAGLRLFLLARAPDALAGFVTLAWDADYPPFRREAVPEIQDLLVLPAFRRAGVATRLLREVEAAAAARADRVGLGVGLYAAYGPAHRLYAARGYLPDGAGATAGDRPLHGGELVAVDDTLVLHLVKRLARAPARPASP